MASLGQPSGRQLHKTAGLLDIPAAVGCCIAEQLGRADRLSLAATCRTLRAASAAWFRGDVFRLVLTADHPTPAQQIGWLCRVQGALRATPACDYRADAGCIPCAAAAQVELTDFVLHDHLSTLNSLAAGGARIIKLGTTRHPILQRWQVPAELAGLTQLQELSCANAHIQGGWQHVPQQLQQLDLSYCALQEVPSQLTGLTQMHGRASARGLSLAHNRIEGGWQHLPRQVQQLQLCACSLQQVPAELASLEQLMRLSLARNLIQGGWHHLPPHLRQLDLHYCGLQEVPAELAGLAQLRKLILHTNNVDGGCQHLPRQLEQLDLRHCNLQQVPPQLLGLTQLRELLLAYNRIVSGWQHLPHQLQQLDLTGCGVRQVLAELASLNLQVVADAL